MESADELWCICRIEILRESVPDGFVIVTFPHGVKKRRVDRSVQLLMQKACVYLPKVCCSTVKQNKYTGTACRMLISCEALHTLRLTGFVEHFRVRKNLRSGMVSKTTPLHPLLLRMYSTRPMFRAVSRNVHRTTCANSLFYNYNPAQLYNFVSITLSWCNHIHCFVPTDDTQLHDLILPAENLHFYIYNYVHRIVDLFYVEDEDFVDAVWANSLIKIVGRFLAIRCVRYMDTAAYERLRKHFYHIYESGLEKEFVIAHKYVGFHLSVKACDLVTDTPDMVDLWAVHDKVRTYNTAQVAYAEVTHFITRIYAMLVDTRMNDVDLARTCLRSLQSSSTPELHVDATVAEGRFSGKYQYSMCISNAAQFESLMTTVGHEDDCCEFRMHEDATSQSRTERLYPLEMFLSVLDQLVMRSRDAQPDSMMVKLCDYSSPLHDTSISLDCFNPVYQRDLDLPVLVRKVARTNRRRKPKLEAVGFQQSFFLLQPEECTL